MMSVCMSIASEWVKCVGDGGECIPHLALFGRFAYEMPPHPPSHMHHCRWPSSCSKNHIHYTQDRHGFHASLKASHFKNEAIKGDQELPLSPSLLKPLSLLEKAIHSCFPFSELMFFDTHGLLYKAPYFSYIVSNVISFGGHHITANDVRHMFVTLWKDFLNSPSTKLLDLTIHDLSACAADLMLNSTAAWSISYDDTLRSRAIHTSLHLWPQFIEFVKQAHIDVTSTKPWDPLTIDVNLLPSDGP